MKIKVSYIIFPMFSIVSKHDKKTHKWEIKEKHISMVGINTKIQHSSFHQNKGINSSYPRSSIGDRVHMKANMVTVE